MSVKAEAIRVQKSRAKSSPELRAKAKAEYDALAARVEEVKSLQTSVNVWLKPLLTAARFVVDVNGDPPSIDQLKAAIDEAERQRELSEEYSESRKRMEAMRGDVRHYQYKAGTIGGIRGFRLFHVLGEGDTKAEAMGKARAAK